VNSHTKYVLALGAASAPIPNAVFDHQTKITPLRKADPLRFSTGPRFHGSSGHFPFGAFRSERRWWDEYSRLAR
jgi:hypothetical protein